MNYPAETRREVPPSRAVIWIIEDDPLFRKGVERLLDRSPDLCCGRAFGACEPALETLRSGEIPHLILMDIGLPGMNGIEGMRQVKLLSPTTPVVLLTIYEDDSKVFSAICAGATGYLLKTSSGKEIIQGIKQVLAGGASMSAQVARRVLEMFPKGHEGRTDYHLTRREREILTFLVEGASTKEIAGKINISYYTIDTHLKNIYVKLYVHSATGAVAKALKEHLV